ncbi:hypothetical protein [Alteromonas sp. RKMC-009]|uniref:hypothetical protein n=1 Tax=Alteromonas sp. RKMC-009 TaxID=2267264 RepID=UPI00123BC13E|nr:hypothetical protein [Alteromonas sp. RKMC-009]AYN07634.2 hypothetical protein DS731_21815 [Alteromonas sp. RKMC-009]
MEIEDKPAVLRFFELTNNFAGLDHVIESINRLDAKNRLDELSENYLQVLSGWGRAKVREVNIILECFGFMLIERGKVTSVNKFFNSNKIDDDEVFKIVKKHILADDKAIAVVKRLSNSIKVGSKLPGERSLKKELSNDTDIGREKLRETLLRLECGGFLLRKNQARRVLLKPLDELFR